MHGYVEGVMNKLHRAISKQTNQLEQASSLIADCVKQGGVLHVLGTGHSHMIAEEIFYRAGGALFVNPILDSGFMLHEGATKSTRMERLSGYAEVLLEGVDIRGYDVFLVVSNSGRNVFPIEATFYMKQKNVYTISISSFEHSKSVKSRHESGKRLFELTDLAFDNYGEVGDAFLKSPGLEPRYGPSSSVVGIVLVQTLISMTIEELLRRDERPPLLVSANMDGSDDKNLKQMELYRDRIPLLR
ncbi:MULTISPECIES: sugar isomerase domain-containing protein [Virgibacillus]|uniref:Uncharacterized protein, contains SIS (Sugar ISomerase) phosphosugar binding domain n=1 Tax=Virgibacillus chiguensis TaxID=411959 RepID=A0A1M5QPA7_9BACI|nr:MULTISPECIES: SIS domain-containing protein [Virgibacillus]SHH15957.1 Uncharacterized protein, contains SIS (Sugar ISomerase) phosphosugar binding domain [Virgibacillus chiguensis]